MSFKYKLNKYGLSVFRCLISLFRSKVCVIPLGNLTQDLALHYMLLIKKFPPTPYCDKSLYIKPLCQTQSKAL